MNKTLLSRKNLIKIIVLATIFVVLVTVYAVYYNFFCKPNDTTSMLLVYNKVDDLTYDGTYNLNYCELYLTAAHMGSKGDREVLYNPYGFLICMVDIGGKLAPFVHIDYDFVFDLYKEGELMESKHIRFIKTDGNQLGSVIRIFETIYGLGDYTLRYSGTISGPAKVTIDGEKYFSIVGEAVGKWE